MQILILPFAEWTTTDKDTSLTYYNIINRQLKLDCDLPEVGPCWGSIESMVNAGIFWSLFQSSGLKSKISKSFFASLKDCCLLSNGKLGAGDVFSGLSSSCALASPGPEDRRTPKITRNKRFFFGAEDRNGFILVERFIQYLNYNTNTLGVLGFWGDRKSVV